MPREVEVVDRLPTVEEYLSLREAVGWRLPSVPDAQRALQTSLFGACAESGGRTIAMGRVVGDGAFYFYVQDVVVEPGWQRSGIGHRLMKRIDAGVVARGAARASLLLVARGDAEPFYRAGGFEPLPDVILGKRVNSSE